jgi:hypothetical protein
LFKTILSGTLLLATLLIPFKASARQEIAYCAGGGVQIRLVDDYTIICRQTNLSDRPIVADDLTLYRFEAIRQVSSFTSLMVYRSGHRIITAIEFRSYCSEWDSHCSRTTQFYLEGRRFSEWVPGRADQDLLDAYSSDVTLLLDALEAFPRESRSF